MSSPEQRWPRWRERLKGFALDHVDLGLGVLVTLLGLILFRFSGIGAIDSRPCFAFLQSIEQSSLDLRFEMRGTRPHDDRIVIVGIDEQTLQKINSFPFPRKNYAELINKLNASGAETAGGARSADIALPAEADPGPGTGERSGCGASCRYEEQRQRCSGPH